MTIHHLTEDAGAGVGDGIEANPASWTFGNGVSKTFDDHVRRSVPGYDAGHELTLALSDFFVPVGGRVYELGCSTGTLAARIAARHVARDVQVHGLDIEPEMILEARRRFTGVAHCDATVADLRDIDFEPCHLVVAHYTLQFLSAAERRDVLRRAVAALRSGGAFVLFEKVQEPSGQFQELQHQLYDDFKTGNGLSSDEILAKTRSLRAVLVPQSSDENVAMMYDAGLGAVSLVQKSLCFEGYLGVKA